jgi:nucleotide sugar dehydrogenase
MDQNTRIAVIGLGYVGLPLAIGLAKNFPFVTGFDINTQRVNELNQGFDRTNEVETADLQESSLKITAQPDELNNHQIFIVTVPTPVAKNNEPDLSLLEKASTLIAPYLQQGAIVVFESTVYPGVTEKVCGPILEKVSGLSAGSDFYLGYSPERINPGDKVHTLAKITKVVAGQTPEVTEQLAQLYGTLNNGNIFKAANIMTAEAAKVIENAQRDINIAFVNEIAAIFNKVGISTYDVLDAARTKWNFLPFEPGLVGGHCIGVDPYYLAHLSQQLGHQPEVILSGRATNENMSRIIAEGILANAPHGPLNILVLGLTFKENVPDLRNTKVIELIDHLKQGQHNIHIHDAFADPKEAKAFYNIDLKLDLQASKTYDIIVGAVPHQAYKELAPQALEEMLAPNGLIVDIKGIWRHCSFSSTIQYRTL